MRAFSKRDKLSLTLKVRVELCFNAKIFFRFSDIELDHCSNILFLRSNGANFYDLFLDDCIPIGGINGSITFRTIIFRTSTFRTGTPYQGSKKGPRPQD